ncbi:MAG: molybdopterin oxidoreductase [Candidatus Dadabacteria bacterium]
MHIGNYLGLVHSSEKDLAKAFKLVATHHMAEPDIFQTCMKMSQWSENHVVNLQQFVERYSEEKNSEPDKLTRTLFDKPRKGSLGLLRDLHDLWLLANEVQLCWIVILQAAQALRDIELELACQKLDKQTSQQLEWLLTRIKQAAPQSLVVAE